MAVGRNPERPADAVYHSDRGCQYTAKKTKELVEKYGFRKSMSRPGTPSDNQPIESFWHTLECEMPDIRHLTFEDASRVLVKYFELYYNSDRLHSGIGYLTPNEYFEKLTL
jgi:transposase InsO family protein